MLREQRDDLLRAAKLLEEAETVHANCPECEGEGVPELCGKCFPHFDDARCARRDAIAKADPDYAAEHFVTSAALAKATGGEQ